MKIAVFWNVTQCSVVERYQHFRGTWRLLQDRIDDWSSQKIIFMVIAVR
jgi:hypothetical protein